MTAYRPISSPTPPRPDYPDVCDVGAVESWYVAHEIARLWLARAHHLDMASRHRAGDATVADVCAASDYTDIVRSMVENALRYES